MAAFVTCHVFDQAFRLLAKLKLFVSDLVQSSQTRSTGIFGFINQIGLLLNQVVQLLDLTIQLLELLILIRNFTGFFTLRSLILPQILNRPLPLFKRSNLLLLIKLFFFGVEQQLDQIINSLNHDVDACFCFIQLPCIQQLADLRHLPGDQRLFGFLVRFDQTLGAIGFLLA